MSEQCPIGLDHNPSICSAGVCRRCLAKRAFWEGFWRGFTKPWTIITDYWPWRKSR